MMPNYVFVRLLVYNFRTLRVLFFAVLAMWVSYLGKLSVNIGMEVGARIVTKKVENHELKLGAFNYAEPSGELVLIRHMPPSSRTLKELIIVPDFTAKFYGGFYAIF